MCASALAVSFQGLTRGVLRDHQVAGVYSGEGGGVFKAKIRLGKLGRLLPVPEELKGCKGTKEKKDENKLLYFTCINQKSRKKKCEVGKGILLSSGIHEFSRLRLLTFQLRYLRFFFHSHINYYFT